MDEPMPLAKGPPPPVQPMAEIQIVLLSNGQLQVQSKGVNPFVLYQALGTAINFLAGEHFKKEQNKIQVAPAGLLLNGHGG